MDVFGTCSCGTWHGGSFEGQANDRERCLATVFRLTLLLMFSLRQRIPNYLICHQERSVHYKESDRIQTYWAGRGGGFVYMLPLS